jgi:hypothetical protein
VRKAVVTTVGFVLAAAVAVPARGAGPGPGQAGFPYRYEVGAAQRDITPTVETNLGGYGLGTKGNPVADAIGPGHTGKPGSERIRVRALVVSDGVQPVAVADIETQGMFAAYKGNGAYGLSDIAAKVAADTPGLAKDHIIVAADHTHAGPDTIGAWGFVPDSYMATIRDSAVAAIEEAFATRRPAVLLAGGSEARGLVYNQNCTEALNQKPKPDYPGPNVCNVPSQDVMDARLRVLQARSIADGSVITTFVSYGAHATLGGGDSDIHGDWPQFLSDRLAAAYGGVGLAMEGAVGRVQPCRPECAHTRATEPDLATTGKRKDIYVDALMRHVAEGLDDATFVHGPVRGARAMIQEPVTSPTVLALFAGGDKIGAELRRSNQSPWMTGTVLGTVVSSLRIGNVLVSGFPGEAYPNISTGVEGSVPRLAEHFPLGLANDQLGYLIAPAEAYPQVAAEIAVNDNSIFNVSPTIGDHVMCASIGLAGRLGYGLARVPARCAAFAAAAVAGA